MHHHQHSPFDPLCNIQEITGAINEKKAQRAVILLSGGVDSSTTLAIAKQEGYETYALSFRYGQRHDREILAAQNVAKYFAVKKHIVLDIDLRSFGGSALTDDIPVPKERGTC